MLVAAVGVVIVPAAPAAAFPCLAGAICPPSTSDCKAAPVPAMPGRGFSGWVDPGPARPTGRGVYDTVEYPPEWHTYDLGCGGAIRDPTATLDTTVGNWLKGAGTVVVALCNSLHRLVSPPTFLHRLDPLLAHGSAAVRDALFTPFVGVTLLLVGVGILWSARRRNMPDAVEAAVWALAVLAVATALWQYPVRAGRSVDQAATTVIGAVNDHLDGSTATGRDPSAARADLLVDTTLFDQWLQGELGSTHSAAARKYGRPLLLAQTFTYAEARRINRDPGAAQLLTDRKQAEFKRLAATIEREDPDAYNHLKGEAGGRAGAGAVSAVAALLVAPFMIVADALVVIALFLIRFIVILFPAVAVIGVHYSMRNLVIGVFERGMASVVNSVAFAVGAGVNALCVRTLLVRSGLSSWVAILLCGLVTVVLWALFKPFRKLGSMVSPRSATRAGSGADLVGGRRQRQVRRGVRGVTRRARRLMRDGSGGEPYDDGYDDPPEDTAPPVAAPAEAWSRPHEPPAEAAAPEPEPSVAVAPRTAPSTVVPAHTPLPPHRRADPILTDHGIVWRIWDPETNTYQEVPVEEARGDA